MERISVDFNTIMQDLWSRDPRVRLGRGAEHPLFRNGQRVRLYDEVMQVDAVLDYDAEHDVWWARPDWSTKTVYAKY